MSLGLARQFSRKCTVLNTLSVCLMSRGDLKARLIAFSRVICVAVPYFSFLVIRGNCFKDHLVGDTAMQPPVCRHHRHAASLHTGTPNTHPAMYNDNTTLLQPACYHVYLLDSYSIDKSNHDESKVRSVDSSVTRER